MQNRMIRVRMLRQAVITAGVAGLLTCQLLTAQNASSPQIIASAEAPPETTTTPASSPTADSAQQPGLTVLDELTAMKRRIEKLEAELKAAKGETGTASPATPASTTLGAPRTVLAPGTIDKSQAVATADPNSAGVSAEDQSSTQPEAQPAAAAPAEPAVDLQTPFAYADFTWMLSNSRNHDEVLDGKYFSGEFRVDTNYMYDYEHPIDHTLIGTTEGERTGEFVIQALNVGGDFHAGNMQGRILTQFGAVSTAVPRNDASYSQGQWDLADAYRYLSEMYAGYHINVQHGLNLQVGDFLSFIGLFSYYSFDNWMYQPSYVSSNTPWFFTGMRAQWFPTNKLKIEPWLINGWQTYAKYNGREGVGGQILWRPTANLDFVWNTYTLGRDTLGNDNRSRYHEDDSQEYKYYENPMKFMHRAAFTVTEDVGCETGGTAQQGQNVVCTHGYVNGRGPSQNFMGIMAYNRWWFDRDRFAAEIGGGVMSNPGRYLVLLPPINGANATSGTPYFPEAPGLPFKAYDFQIGADYMPSQWVTWHVEWTQRGSNVPYFSGPGGITPDVVPGTYVNVGAPGSYVPGFTPDLVKQERRWIFALMVKL
jgi:Putative beta-barrel porin-2, OmpL-like. bbp2